MYEVLALDLDGTVLTETNSLHPNVKAAIQEATHKWHVIIVTGRHHTAARPYYDELGLSTPVICCNGTYLYDFKNEKVISQNAILKKDALKFIKLAHKNNFKLVMYITDAMTYSKSRPIAYMQAMEKWAHELQVEQPPKIYRINSFSQQVQETDYVWKFVIEGAPSDIKHFMEDPWIHETFTAERSWPNRIDFAAKGNNKGSRLAGYVASLGYQPDQVIAVGDNHNDISMIEYAGLGIAMLNADDMVKKHANLVCLTDNNHDGLARLIREKL